MKNLLKLFSLLLVIALAFGCSLDASNNVEAEPDKGTDWIGGVQIGDRFTIKMSNDGSTTIFDYTGLNPDNDSITAVYFADNTTTTSTLGVKSEIYEVNGKDAKWFVGNNPKDLYLEPFKLVSQDIMYKPTFTNSEHSNINFAQPIGRVAIELSAHSDFNPSEINTFYLKGLTANGTGEVEVVGYYKSANGTTNGDTDLYSPMK